MTDYNDIISVDAWSPDETYDGLFPKGAREKSVYFTPNNPFPPFLKPNHRHLFKKSSHRYPWQFWMEIIAFRIGHVMGVAVPPTYVAISEKEGDGQETIYGALIEWFYDTDDIYYVDGGCFMSAEIEGFDAHKGKQHNLKTILGLPLFQPVEDAIIDHWAKILAFDTVIGNVDRHQDNWGVMFRRPTLPPNGKDASWIRLSPAFDNGTALAYEIIEPNFGKYEKDAEVVRYLTRPKRARHHMRWSLESPEDMNFFDFMRRFLESYPRTRSTIQNLLRFTREDIEPRLRTLPAIPVAQACRLTEQRLDLIIRLVMKRKELLEKSIEVH